MSKQRSLDEINAELADIAFNGEGAQKLRALQMLKAEEGTSTVLPQPMTDSEVVERLTRLIRAAGPIAAQLAYRNAFKSARPIEKVKPPKLTIKDMTVDRASLPRSLRTLYTAFPECRPKGGFPKGYPHKDGLEACVNWCQDKAIEMLRTRQQASMDAVSTEEHIPEPSEANGPAQE